MVERFSTDPSFRSTGDPSMDVKAIERGQSAWIEVDGSRTQPGDLIVVLHKMDRIPRKLVLANIVMNEPPSSGTGWYRLSSDPPWSKQSICFRMACSFTTALLEVF